MGEVKGRTSDEIRSEIERVRENLARDVTALEVSVREKLDWKRPIRERPMMSVGAALGAGMLLGLLV
jgi:ElaB/YqjD/DUF883 family membrane-anchored ribosome-binding protein